jgi:dCTP deaminase
MILSDGEIHFLRELGGYLDIEPWNPGQVQPASYDLTLGKHARFIRADQPDVYALDLDRIDVRQGDFYLLHTEEIVTLGPKIGGQVCGKSTWARKGLIVESAGWVDPGFSGQLVLEVTNLSPRTVSLYPGQPIAQIVFMELKSPAQRPYGPARGSHYQGQIGATPAYGSSD